VLLAYKTAPNWLFALQFLELKPLCHAVYLFCSIKISERNSLVSLTRSRGIPIS
jgi:hypothetical protein